MLYCCYVFIAGVALLERVKNEIKRYVKTADLPLMLLVTITAAYGVLLVASATHTFSSNRTLYVQIIAAVLGFTMMFLISLVDYEILGELWIILLIGTVGMMGLTLLIGTGPTGSGNRNWIDLGFFDLQTSEFAKLTFIIILASLADRFGENLNKIRNLLVLAVFTAFMCGLVLLQGDMGMTVVYILVAMIMLFVAGVKLRYFLIFGALAGAAAPFVWKYLLSSYMKNRIIYGFNPELDPLVWGYQAVQGKIAIGSGMFWGKGLFQGTQIHSGRVPAHHTDFIFTVAGEELGFIGCMAVIVLLVLIMTRILRDSRISSSTLGSLICVGVFAVLFVQSFINLFMCIGMFPIIGITLPFFSYGGSSMLSNFCGVGLVCSVVFHKKTLFFSID